MTITRKEIYGFVLAVCVVIVGAAYWHAKTGVDRAQQVREDVQQQIGSLRGDLKDALSKIAHDRSEAKTPQQIVQKLPQYIELPKPIYIQGPQTVPSSGNAAVLPDAPDVHLRAGAEPGVLVIPPESASAFFEHETACKENELKLAECSKELPLVEKRAQAAEKAMKGGSFFNRLKANSKWFIAGAAAGAAAYGISHH